MDFEGDGCSWEEELVKEDSKTIMSELGGQEI